MDHRVPLGPAATPARSRVAVLLAVVLSVLGLAVPVLAQDGPTADNWDTQLPRVSAVAAGDEVEVALLAADTHPDPATVSVRESGEPVEVSSVIAGRDVGLAAEVVFVIDVNNRNAREGILLGIGRTILDQVDALPDNTRVGVVTAGREAVVRVPLTANADRLGRSLLDLRAERGSVLYDGLAAAAGVFSSTDGVARTVVLVSAGNDSGSSATAAGAGATLVQHGVQLLSLSFGAEAPTLADIAAGSGGAHVGVADSQTLIAQIPNAAAMAMDRLLVTFDGRAGIGERASLSMTIGDRTLNLSYPAGVSTFSVAQLAPLPEPADGGHAFFGSPLVLWGSVLLAFVTIVMAVWALGSLFVGGESTLDAVMARYADGEDLDDDDVKEMLVQSSLVRRAVELTEALAEDRGVSLRVERLLERADLPMRAGEALFFLAVASCLSFILVWIVAHSILVGFVAGCLVAAISYFGVQFLARRRLNKFETQLPDTLNMLAGTLRAGYSLPQGINAVAGEMADPMGEELRRAMTENQLGREIDESLAGVAERLDSPDFAWAVMAIGIQREVGGNLNELLLTVADTMVQRQRIRREVSALTAEGRVSAGILSMLPPGLGLVLWVMNPDYVNVLFSNTLGLILLGAAVVSALVGLIWMKKVITIDA